MTVRELIEALFELPLDDDIRVEVPSSAGTQDSEGSESNFLSISHVDASDKTIPPSVVTEPL